MVNISLPFSLITMVLGLYSLILGMMLTRGKQVLDIYTILVLWFIRLVRGQETSKNYRERILSTRNFKFYGVYYIFGGILLLLIVLIANS
jgi:hypothetical protein